MPSKIKLLLEAEKRGILPEEKKPLLEEARRRGLVPTSQGPTLESAATQFLGNVPGIRDTSKALMAPFSEAKEFASGVSQGFKGETVPPQASLPQKAGGFVGKYGPAGVGMGLAGMATGGMGVIPAALASGFGAAGGEAYKQLGSRAIGGKAPETSGEAAKELSVTGTDAFLNDLGFKVAGKGLGYLKDEVLPVLGEAWARIPEFFTRRAYGNLKSLPQLGDNVLSVEMRAVNRLHMLQDGIESDRSAVGKEVGQALERLHSKTGGENIFDLEPVVKYMEKIMSETKQLDDPAVAHIVRRDKEQFLEILKKIRESPQKSAKAINALKQEVQDTVAFSNSSLPRVESGTGQYLHRELGKRIGTLIDETAERAGDVGLKSSNSRASSLYKYYDEIRPLMGSKNQGAKESLKALDRISKAYSQEGLLRAELENMGEQFPNTAKHLNPLLDDLTSLSFLKELPSEHRGAAVRLFERAAKRGVAASTIKAVATTEGLMKMIKPYAVATRPLGRPFGLEETLRNLHQRLAQEAGLTNKQSSEPDPEMKVLGGLRPVKE